MSRWVQKLRSVFTGATHVGTDSFGNKYFSRVQSGEIRRHIEYKNGEMMPTAELSPLWRAWLTKKRDLPPTDQELQVEDQKKRWLKQRVAELEREDAKLRLQEIAEREGRDHNVDMSPAAFLRGMMGDAIPAPPTSEQPSTPPAREPPTVGAADQHVESWDPSKR
eukprot:TRINITY_DN21163_c0_g1_i1.p1 TRINITY_DN21163_c0_g1~~TRINITY_DN21163_c0_g1_i1.p1  ORF type:complete len:165 (+),score=36.03 TRINITY_DN21163_c0_g1_i1:131-625(+)